MDSGTSTKSSTHLWTRCFQCVLIIQILRIQHSCHSNILIEMSIEDNDAKHQREGDKQDVDDEGSL